MNILYNTTAAAVVVVAEEAHILKVTLRNRANY